MNILHVVAGLPPSGGGLSELVPRLAHAAACQGHAVTIATVASGREPLSEAANEAVVAGVRLLRFRRSRPRALFLSWDMLCRFDPTVSTTDIVHVHSNWTFPVWWGSQCALKADKPLVISPHGCLDPIRLGHSAWKKRLAGVFDRRFLRQATVLHATSDAERTWIANYVRPGPAGRQEPAQISMPRIEVIPNGVVIPPALPAPAKPPDRVRQALYLGRLHPLKGLDLLVAAWHMAQPTGWQLVIAGPDEQGTHARTAAQARDLRLAVGQPGSSADVGFSGPLHGAAKARVLAAADLVVLPSRSENFGIVVAEALAAGVPVIATTATPWRELQDGCGWWIDADASALATALTAATSLPDERRAAMGRAGRRLVSNRYSWDTVGTAMTSLYRTLLESDM